MMTQPKRGGRPRRQRPGRGMWSAWLVIGAFGGVLALTAAIAVALGGSMLSAEGACAELRIIAPKLADRLVAEAVGMGAADPLCAAAHDEIARRGVSADSDRDFLPPGGLDVGAATDLPEPAPPPAQRLPAGMAGAPP